MKELSAVAKIHQWCCELGAGFAFINEDIPHETLGIDSNVISSALFILTKEGRLWRAPRAEHVSERGGRLRYFYRVTEECLKPRKARNACSYKATRNRSKGYNAGGAIVAEQQKTVSQLADAIIADLVALKERAERPLASFTNAELIAELHRRNGADIAVQTG